LTPRKVVVEVGKRRIYARRATKWRKEAGEKTRRNVSFLAVAVLQTKELLPILHCAMT
jgi:hypothetical protein